MAEKRRHGGLRPGAGRPRGSKNALPEGYVSALKSLRWNVPEDAPEEIADLAGETLAVMVALMRDEVPGHLLQPAVSLRRELTGPPIQRVEHAGPGGGAINIEINLGGPGAKQVPGASATHGSGGPQPESGGESGSAEGSGPGIQPGGQTTGPSPGASEGP